MVAYTESLINIDSVITQYLLWIRHSLTPYNVSIVVFIL